MKKLMYFLVLVLFTANIGYSQVTTLWENSAATSNLPAWFSTGNGERGLAYGSVAGNDRVYVVSRSSTFGNNIYIYNATNGDSVGLLNTTGISGGLFIINDVEVSSNGVIFVSNMTTDASVGANPFKVYRYTAETDTPVAVISYNTAVATRLGDKFTVTGSTADNSVTIWAASGTTKELYKFTTTDNGITFTPTIIQLPSLGTVSLGSAAVGPLPNGDFYYNAGGQPAQKFLADGTVIDTVSTGIIATGTNAIRFMSTPTTDEFFATYAYGPTNETGRIVKIPGGDLNLAELVGVTPILGTNGNAGGTGDLSIQLVSPFIYNIYVLGTNNGFGAYQVDLRTPLAGDYYVGAAGTGPGGTDPDFASLRDAFQVINNANITGDCSFFITSDITEVTTPGGIGLAVNPEPYTITIKPYTGVTPVITLPYTSDGNSGPSGAFVIGIPMDNNIAWADLRTTKNIVIDGSNTVGGSSLDLTIENQTNSVRNSFPLTIVGDVSNLTVKNTKIYYKAQGVSTFGNLFAGAVQIRSRRDGVGGDWIPNNIFFENNHISSNFPGVVQNVSAYVVTQLQSATPLYPFDITLKNNLIEGKRRAIALNNAGSHDIIGNEITLSQDIAANTTNEAILFSNIGPGSVFNVYENKFSKISSITNGSGFGNSAINIEGLGIYNIYNNFIYGFELTAANPVAYLYGVRNASADASMNLYYNSILMNDIADIGTGTVDYSGVLLSNGTNDLKNNIIVTAEVDFVSYCLNKPGTAGTLTSNYNNFYPVSATNGNVGFWDAAATPTLANWQSASGQDANSKSKEVFFVSNTDLHLTGSSLGDFDLAGTPIPGITTDIDGDTRDANSPYMGADEGNIPLGVITIAEAREDLNGDLIPDRLGQTVTIQGVVISPNYQTTNHSYYIWDGTAGITEILFGTTNPVLNLGDLVRITGVIGQFRGLTQIQPAASSDITFLSAGNPVPGPVVLSIANYMADPEAYEATLVGFVSVNKVSGTWPSPGGSATIKVTDGTDTVDIRIDSDTDLDDNPEPVWPVDLLGLGSQFSSGTAVLNDGYQILPRYYATDILPPGTIPVELTSFTASVVNGNVTLSWTTASETNNRGFEIERSTSGEFVTIGFVEGSGTSLQEKTYSYVDPNLASGMYSYRLKQIDLNGSFEYSGTVEVDVTAPTAFELAQNYPNPFNPATVIEYSIASPVNVTLTVYTILGEQVAVLVNNQFTEAGKYSISFNASSLASGTYIYRLQAGEFVSVKKMLLAK